MPSSNTFLDRLGLGLPIIQAPMAGVSTPAMAAAVSNAGGLGSLGVGASSVSAAKKAIEDTRALTGKPFNVNLFCHAAAQRDARRETDWLHALAPFFTECGGAAPATLDEIYTSFVGDDEALAMLVEQKPAVVSFHFGLPSNRALSRLREAGIYTLATATGLAEAALIEAAGIDAIVAQGAEAGGHRGVFDPDADDQLLSTSVLVRLLVRQTRLPVIAAGGIMDGQGIRAAFDLGAVAAQLGTAFILCPESAASENHRQGLMSSRAASTTMTSALSGRPARGLTNRLTRFGGDAGAPRPAAYPVAYDAAKQLHALASKQGNHEFAAEWAGQGAPLARPWPAAELVTVLAEEWKAAGG